MKTQLPMTSEDFCQHLQDAGLIPRDVLVQSITVYARPQDLVTLHVEILPGIEIAEALK